MRFTVRADRQLIRAGARSRRFVCAEIQAPEAPPRPGRLPVNLAFVLDRSGSMEGNKIAHARAAILQGIRSLRDEDRFAVVAYDNEIDVVVSTTLATAAAREAAAQAVARIAPRASTDLEGGWQRGCEQVVEHLSAEAVGRCLLLTDGLANAGVTDHDEIVRRCAAWRERRVATTAFGVGVDFDETLLRRMADAGGGHFEFIESAVQIADFVASEVGEALAITAREAVLVVEAGEGAVVESINDFPCRRDGQAWRVELGSLFGGQCLNPVLRVTLPEGEVGSTRDVTVYLEDADGALGRPTATVRFTGASHEENDRQPRDRAIDRRVAALYGARAERDALERNRAHDFTAAREIARALHPHIGVTPATTRRSWRSSRTCGGKVARYSHDMDRVTRKTLHSTSSYSLKERSRKTRSRHGGPGGRPGLARPRRPAAAGPRPPRSRRRGPLRRPGVRGGTQPLGARSGCGARPRRRAAAPRPRARRSLPMPPSASSSPPGPSPTTGSRTGTRTGGPPSCRSPAGTARSAVPAEAFVAYEVLHHGLRRLGPAWAPERLAHAETRGCLFDFCAHRSDVDIKLQAADFCPSCHNALAAAGVPMDRLQRLAEAVRMLAASAQVVH